MPTCTRVKSGKMEDKNKTRYVKYYYDDGTVVERIGGSKSWRNNNPGNVVRGPGRIGKDEDGIAIFPDLPTGRKARKVLFMPGGKFYDYDSAREVLRGLYDKEGHQISGTGYAPKYDKDGKVINDPDAYADFVRQYFRKYYRAKHDKDMDIEEVGIRDYTPEMQDVLEEAQEAQEKFKEGTVRKYGPTGRLVGNASGVSFPGNVTATSGGGSRTSAQAGGPFVPDLTRRPNLLGPIPPMWDPGALPTGKNWLAGDSPLNLPAASANLPFQYSPNGVRGANPLGQPALAPTDYPTRLLPSDSPFFPRRNAFLEPAQPMTPWAQPQSVGKGTPAPPTPNLIGPWPGSYLEGSPDVLQNGSRNAFDPWPGSYPPGRKNLFYPDLERLLGPTF